MNEPSFPANRRWPVYILAGGRSARFGGDKALAEVAGQPLLSRIADSARPFAESVTVVADRADKYENLGLATIADATPHLGPLGGLLAALRHCEDQSGKRWIVLLSCDLVAVRQAWIERLAATIMGGAPGAAFFDGRWQPFPGLYHTSLSPLVERRLASGDASMQPLLSAAGCHLADPPADWPDVASINTHDDLARLTATPDTGAPPPSGAGG